MCAAVLGAATLALSTPSVAVAQTDDVRRRLEALEAGQKELLKQVQELKATVQSTRSPVTQAQAAPVPPTETLSVEGSATRGQAAAKLTIVEFSDFECPFCGRFARESFDLLDHDYIATGKVRYVFRNYPLERIHPRAFKAALAGECARQSGRFWELHHALFANQQALGDVDLLNQAKAVGIASADFQRCVMAPQTIGRIRTDLEDGTRAGTTGTPMFFLGVTQKDGRLKVLRKMSGAIPYGAMKAAVDALLASPDVAR